MQDIRETAIDAFMLAFIIIAGCFVGLYITIVDLWQSIRARKHPPCPPTLRSWDTHGRE